ncbi:unnamed protein product, partial [Allacma fusca]
SRATEDSGGQSQGFSFYFFWVHLMNNNDQCAPLNSSETGNITTLAECLDEKKLTFTLLRYDSSDYDPRIGLKVDDLPDPNFEYEFNVPWGTVHFGTDIFRPFKSDSRIYSKLRYDNRLDLIRCDITTPGSYSQPDILVGKCESLIECQLKFEPLWPNIFTSGYKILTNQFEEIRTSENVPHQSFATTFSQGYLECSGRYGSDNKFLSTIDYFFTGLDSRKYLVSEDFPLESIIKVSTKHEQPMRAGMTYSFDCKISTFVLLPNIQFVLGFENGDEQLVTVTKQTSEAGIANVGHITKTATLTWQSRVTIKVGINKITCYAPRINSSDWAQSKINLKVMPDVDSGDQLPLYIKIGGAIGGVAFLALAILVIFLARRKTVVIVRNLTPEEVEEFLSGSRNRIPGQSESLPIENMAFHHKLKISSQDLITENTVIGS